MNNNEIRESLVNICHMVYEKDMVCGSGGNISIKSGNRIFITPSGYSLGTLKPEDIIEVTLDGKYSGNVKPSMELFLHMKAYEIRSDISVIIHVHSLYSIIAGIMADEKSDCPMPPYTPGYAVKVRRLTQVPFFAPGSVELANSISIKLKESDVVFMRNHGMIIAGKEFEEAFNVAEEVEANARMHIILGGQGFLTEQQLKTML